MTDAIQEWIERVARIPISGDDQPPDVCVIEVGQWVLFHEGNSCLAMKKSFGV